MRGLALERQSPRTSTESVNVMECKDVTLVCALLLRTRKVKKKKLLVHPVTSQSLLNHLTPKDPYKDRTAQLTSKVAFYIFIQQI